MSEIKTLHDPFSRYLREQGIPFIRARSDRESTIAVGWPDFTLVPASHCLCIEFKTKEGKLSTEQKQCIAALDAAGTTVHVLRDLGQSIELVTHWSHGLKRQIAVNQPQPIDQRAAVKRKWMRYGLAWFEEGTGARMRALNDSEKERNATQPDP